MPQTNGNIRKRQEHGSSGRYDYDVAVIGAGPGGYATALRAAELGLKTALIEKDATLGGTCLNRGCIPTKALLTAAHAREEISKAQYWGISVDETAVSANTGKLFEQKAKITGTMVSGLASLIDFRGITVIKGYASISGKDGPHTVRVSADGTGKTSVTAGNVILALGSCTVPFPGVGFSDTVLDSDRALELAEIPETVGIIGSGAIALEFASFWNAMGSSVTVFMRKGRPLSHGDSHMGASVMRGLKRAGIKFIPSSHVTDIAETRESKPQAVISYTRGTGDSSEVLEFKADKVLIAIGRRPATESPWLHSLNIAIGSDGIIKTDPFGKTSIPNIWAAGDVTAGRQLAHKAFAQGIVIAESIACEQGILSTLPRPVDEKTVPQVVYSTTEATSVGYTSEQAQGLSGQFTDVEETVLPLLSNSRVLMEQSGGSITVVTARHPGKGGDTRYVIGIHIAGVRAGELIAEAEQIIGNHIPLADAARLIHPHPTLSESLGEALLKADGRPLHVR